MYQKLYTNEKLVEPSRSYEAHKISNLKYLQSLGNITHCQAGGDNLRHDSKCLNPTRERTLQETQKKWTIQRP